MLLSTSEITSYVGGYMWPFIRIGAVLMVAPVFGAKNIVSKRIRVSLALAITLVVAPLLPTPPAVDPFSSEAFLILLQQLLLGILMGFTLQVAFSALIVAGHNISMSMGLGFAQFLDPTNGVSVPVLGQLLTILGTLLFLSLNGHLVVIQVMVESFRNMPVGPVLMDPQDYKDLAFWGGRMFMGALLIALPATVTITLINIAFGIMTRAAPTLNIFSVGFPTTMGAGFLILIITIPNLLPRFTDILMDAFDVMQSYGGSAVAGG
ncbi:MAG TPA: flagellar biosynthetic protein FliR [Gammaproteobacteria bacterium]|nr:flagellar biosynthetic protein FliR [Gammaproteobacteria bacterium]